MIDTVDRITKLSEAILNPDRSPADRGAADSYYRRSPFPHKYVNGKEVELEAGTAEHYEYMRAYEQNESIGNFKKWSEQ